MKYWVQINSYCYDNHQMLARLDNSRGNPQGVQWCSPSPTSDHMAGAAAETQSLKKVRILPLSPCPTFFLYLLRGTSLASGALPCHSPFPSPAFHCCYVPAVWGKGELLSCNRQPAWGLGSAQDHGTGSGHGSGHMGSPSLPGSLGVPWQPGSRCEEKLTHPLLLLLCWAQSSSCAVQLEQERSSCYPWASRDKWQWQVRERRERRLGGMPPNREGNGKEFLPALGP